MWIISFLKDTAAQCDYVGGYNNRDILIANMRAGNRWVIFISLIVGFTTQLLEQVVLLAHQTIDEWPKQCPDP